MPSKCIRIYDAGIRVWVPSVSVEEQTAAILAIAPSAQQLRARHLQLEFMGAYAFRDGRSVLFESYGLVRQDRTGLFSRMDLPARPFWDDAIWFTDAAWLRSFGLNVARNASRFASCGTCGESVGFDSIACPRQCGVFQCEESFGQRSGIKLEGGYGLAGIVRVDL